MAILYIVTNILFKPTLCKNQLERQTSFVERKQERKATGPSATFSISALLPDYNIMRYGYSAPVVANKMTELAF